MEIVKMIWFFMIEGFWHFIGGLILLTVFGNFIGYCLNVIFRRK
jgi:hypothetical protein